jgi:hypothetical protein
LRTLRFNKPPQRSRRCLIRLADVHPGILGAIAGVLGTLRAVEVLKELFGSISRQTPSRSRSHRGSVRVRRETCDRHGEIVQTFTARLVVPRRVASQSDISGAEPALSKSAKS